MDFSDAGFRLLGPLEDVDLHRTVNRFVAGDAFMRRIIDERRYRPGGVVATIVDAVGAGTLDREEAVSLSLGIAVAGVDTSIASLATAAALLAADQAQWRLLREEPQLSARAFEEALRFDGPILYWFRECRTDVELAGTRIPAGSRVMISLDSTGRDDARFANADRYDLRNDPKGNLAFGRGEHLCLGAQVARLEGRVVLETLARRLSVLELNGAPVRRDVAVIRAYDRLPMRIAPA